MGFTFTDVSGQTVGTTEYSLPKNANYSSGSPMTTDGYVQVFISLANMTVAETYQVSYYERVAGGTQTLIDTATITGTSSTLYISPMMLLGDGWDVTLKKTAGTDRAFSWSVRQDTNDVNVASISNGVIAAATFAANAITSSVIAASAIGASQIASAALTAAKFATDAIDSNALAASAVTEIQTGLATSSALATVQADTDDIQTRLPAALVGGRMSSDVGSWLGTVAATPTVAGVPKVEVSSIVANAIGATQLASAAITAAKFATDAIDANALAAGAVAEIQSGLATSSSVSAVASAVAVVQADTDDIQNRLPATLDSGNMRTSVQSLTAGALTAIAGAILDFVLESGAGSGAQTVAQRLRIGLGILINKATGLAITTAGTEHFRDAGDTKDRATYTVATDGTRTPTALDGT